MIIDRGNLENLIGRQLDAPTGRGPLEFKHRGGFSFLGEDQIDPVKWAFSLGGWVGDPVPSPRVVFVFIRAPGNAGCY